MTKLPAKRISRRANTNYNSFIIALLGERAVLFNPELARIANSVIAGLFLSQLLFWWGKGSNRGWIYKTIKEVQEETCLNRSEQDRAIISWKRLGVIDLERRGVPQKRYFHIHENRLIRLLESTSGKNLLRSANQSAGFDKLNGEYEQTNTESTSENTNRDVFLQKRTMRSKELGTAKKNLVRRLSVRHNPLEREANGKIGMFDPVLSSDN